MGYLLSIDAGTTREYQLLTPGPDLVEFDAEDYWFHCKRGIAEALESGYANPEEIVALSISCQSETLVVLDRGGRPLRRAIVWLDNRSDKESEAIAGELGEGCI